MNQAIGKPDLEESSTDLTVQLRNGKDSSEPFNVAYQEMLVEAAGVELFSVLTARKVLVLRMARGAKKAPLPIPLYVYCTKMLSGLDSWNYRY